eukprot:TRINITY_DN1449_c0_g1_i1.p1 TRINITY_DN1449_c0_g1~~TRINITY_DN1449_c0_g1_i1.p1  ORF type:complete len:264 (+),score=46.79 TRINITY_DN1449_c0_g1_i1:85-876(+)
MGFLPPLGKQYFLWALRSALAEFIAVGVLVFGSCAAIVSSGLVGLGSTDGGSLTNPRLLIISFAHGMLMAICVAFSWAFSGGHVNPAITLGFLATGQLDILSSIIYIVSQLCGAMIGAGFVKAIYHPWEHELGLGVQNLGEGISEGKGVLVEGLATFILVFTFLGTATIPKGPMSIAPICIGLSVFVDNLFAFPLTGASMNPARSFGPAVWMDKWSHHWVYWVGPFVGASAAALMLTLLSLLPDHQTADVAPAEQEQDVEYGK